MDIGKLSDKEIDVIYQKLGTEGIKLLYELKTADLLVQNKKYHYILSDYNIQKKILSKYNKY